MRKLLISMLMAGTASVTACNSEGVNDGENYLDFIPAPAGPICVAVECKTDGDCNDPAAQYCAPQTGDCSECATDADCVELAATSTVFEGRGLCRSFTCVCSTDQFCQDSGEGQVCVAGACAECGRDSDCPAATPACIGAGTPDASCGCGSDSDCAADEQCIGGACVCANNSACAANETCDTEAGVCFECTVNGDCADPTPFCADRTCVECTDDAECDAAALEICDDGTCTAQECLADGDCAAGQFCDGNECADAACTSDADCAGNPEGEFCRNADDPASAECTCTQDSHCATAGRTRCYFPNNSGRYCGCADNADCAAGNEGDTCIPGDFNRSSASGCQCSEDSQCGDPTENSCRNPP